MTSLVVGDDSVKGVSSSTTKRGGVGSSLTTTQRCTGHNGRGVGYEWFLGLRYGQNTYEFEFCDRAINCDVCDVVTHSL